VRLALKALIAGTWAVQGCGDCISLGCPSISEYTLCCVSGRVQVHLLKQGFAAWDSTLLLAAWRRSHRPVIHVGKVLAETSSPG
jgi:hypothetical protein